LVRWPWTRRSTSTETPEELIARAQSGDELARERLIRDWTPLVLRVGARSAGRYVEVGRDEEVSVGLLALNEAIDRFQLERGAPFAPFAELVIKRRLVDFYRRRKGSQEIPLSHLAGEDDEGNPLRSADEAAAVALFEREREAEDRREEIGRYAQRLAEFGVLFTDLVEASPKHADARARALEVAHILADDPALVAHFRTKRELPLKSLEERVGVSRKTLERQRKWIVAVTVLLLEDFEHLKGYVAL
jgi:RNA polymerase sigma factor